MAEKTIRMILEKVKAGALSVEEGTTILESLIPSAPPVSSPVSPTAPDLNDLLAGLSPGSGSPAPGGGSGPGSPRGSEDASIEEVFRQAGLGNEESREAVHEIDRILRETLGRLKKD